MSIAVIEIDDLKKIISAGLEETLKSALDKFSPGISLPDRVLTQSELCTFLKTSRQTISRLKKKGKIPFLEIGSETRFDLAKVLSAIEKANNKS
jgi:excisionase family DNA binding protein